MFAKFTMQDFTIFKIATNSQDSQNYNFYKLQTKNKIATTTTTQSPNSQNHKKANPSGAQYPQIPFFAITQHYQNH